jgi:hypothetical protein
LRYTINLFYSVEICDNFKDRESEILIRYGRALIVENACDLTGKIRKFISDKKLLENTGRNALKAVKSKNRSHIFYGKKTNENLLKIVVFICRIIDKTLRKTFSNDSFHYSKPSVYFF